MRRMPALAPALVTAMLLVSALLAGCSYERTFSGGSSEWRVAMFGLKAPESAVSLVDNAGTEHPDILNGWFKADVGSIDDISSITFGPDPNSKLSNDEDAWRVFYTEIDPLSDNFTITAVFHVLDVGARAGNQAGFGVCATDLAGIDLAGKEKGTHRYFNSISCLTMQAHAERSGMRGAYGYISPDASDPEVMRRCNVFEPFETTAPIEEGKSYCFSLEKTDEGFTGRFGDEELSIPDEGFVAVQDDDVACVGVLVAGDISVEVTDVHLEVTPAGPDAKVTTKRDIDAGKTEYAAFGPADERPIADVIAASAAAADDGELVCVAPDGTPDGLGTTTYPLDLATAVAGAEAGQTIVLKSGTYEPGETLRLEASGTGKAPIGLVSAGNGPAVFEGAGVEVAGSWWHLRGIEIAHAPGVGLLVSGSDNAIERCEVRECGDSGLQITKDLDATETELRENRADWPSRNLVLNCDSHDNCDEARQDADGFAAKIACGEGNVFYGCAAHHNIDDGWDLYSKAAYGPIGAVRIENCVSYDNGRTTADEGGDSYDPGEGNGFKLGARVMPVEHVLANSVAVGNLGCGITANGSPRCRVEHCTAFDNGRNCVMVPAGDDVLLAIASSIFIPGGHTEKGDALDDALVDGDCVIIDADEVGPDGRDARATSYLKSLDKSSIGRDAETGNLSLNSAFEARTATGAHF